MCKNNNIAQEEKCFLFLNLKQTLNVEPRFNTTWRDFSRNKNNKWHVRTVHVAWSGKSHFINIIKYIFNTKPDYNLVFFKEITNPFNLFIVTSV